MKPFKHNLFVPSVRTTNYGLKQLKANGPRVWNELPSEVKDAGTLTVFSKRLKEHYLVSYST